MPQRVPRGVHLRRQPGELARSIFPWLSCAAHRPSKQIAISRVGSLPQQVLAVVLQVLNLLGLRHLTMDTHLVRANPGSELYLRHARMTRCLPQFLVIGTQKGGTSSFHFLLKSGWHDDVQVPKFHAASLRTISRSRPDWTHWSLHSPPWRGARTGFRGDTQLFRHFSCRSTMAKKRYITSAGTTTLGRVLLFTSSASMVQASGLASVKWRAKCVAR